MKFTAQQIATLVQGKIDGDANAKVNSFAKIEEGQPGDLSFLANPKYEDHLYTSQASIIIINESLALKHAIQATLIRVQDAYAAFAILMQTYEHLIASKPKQGQEEYAFVSKNAQVSPSSYIGSFSYVGERAEIAENVQIHPQTYIGDDVKIGPNTIIYPGVKIYKQCIIGSNCVIHAGSVIGSDGFGFAHEDGQFKKIPQIGNVVIEDDVEIGANCTIDRATMGSTRIKKGVKLDNLIQIAHNVEIGESSVIASQAGISGSTRVGKHAMIGGQAGVVGHLKLADGIKINAQSGVTKNVQEPNQSLTGSPAFEYIPSLKSQVIFRQLPSLMKRVIELENKIKQLEK